MIGPRNGVSSYEKTTKKTSTNSSIPPSQADKDETKKAPRKDRDTSAAENSMTSENFETTTVEEVSTVEVCDSCGTDLSDVEPCAREQRVLRDIKFTVVDLKVDAEIKDCPECRARTKGRFPENMPGPLQYGNGIKAFMINLLVTQMVSLNRAVGLLQAMSGIKLSEATCLNYIQRLHDELEPWEADTKEHLLTRPALHADETGLKVNKKNHWMHVLTNGLVTLKYLHRKRGKEAIDFFGIIPFYIGTLIHDRWAIYFLYFLCKHQVCGSQGVPMLGVISGFDPFTGNLRFCWLSVAHTVMQVSWTSGQTYSRALRTDFIPAMCPCALLVLMSAYAGTG